jgi:hypothetical protein
MAGDNRPRPDPVIPGSARGQDMALRARIAALRFAGDWEAPDSDPRMLSEADVYEIADRAYGWLTRGLTLLKEGPAE